MIFSGSADAKIIYVNGANTTAGNGTTWSKAYIYLRDALDASVAGDSIFIAKGIYYPDDGASGYYGDRELSFEVDGVNLYGGFSGVETSIDQRDVEANPTILSGEIWTVAETPNPEIYWSLHVVILKNSSTFDGLTIERGRANGRTTPYNQGGGVFVQSGTLTLVNCSINECLAEQDGGAVFGNVVATGCTFSGNRSDNERKVTNALLLDPTVYDQFPDTKHSWLFNTTCTGGAITGNVTATDCKFLDNHVRARCVSKGITSAASGGAIAGTVSARDCVFDGNTANSTSYYYGQSDAFATSRGGAIAGASTLVDCVFTNNEAISRARAFLMPIPPGPPYHAWPLSYGGAVTGQIGATNCVFADNSVLSVYLGGNVNHAQSWGGAVDVEGASDILNSVFVRNDTAGNGAGGGCIRAQSTAVLPIINSTFLDNTTDLSGTCLSVGGNVKILSNIFWSSAPAATPEKLIFVDAYGPDSSAFATISNRLYPTPSTETINIVRGTIDVNGRNTGISSFNADIDFGDQVRTLPITDPLFVDMANPEGADGIWKTPDDGLRLTDTSPAIALGHPLFLPTDKFDLDEDGNITETSPVDVADFARIQDDTLDLGAYEFGEDIFSPEIQVEQPAGAVLTDGVGYVSFGASPGVPAVKTFVIRNIGTLALKKLSISKTGTNSADFIVSQPVSRTVGTDSTTTFVVTLNPTTQGLKTAAIHIASNDTDENPFDIELQGETLLPDITVDQPAGTELVDGVSTINYGTVAALSSSSKTFVIGNNGLAKLSILSVSLSGAAASDYSIVAPSQTVLAPGEVSAFRVTFAPTVAGTRNATITIKSNDPDAESFFTIAVTGNGVVSPEIAVRQPSSVNLTSGSTKSFGNVKTNLAYTKQFTIKNVGSSKLKNLSLTLSGSSTYSSTDLSVSSLQPGESTKFTVTFKPKSTGTKNATLTIGSNDSDENPFTIKLTGTGYTGSAPAAKSALVAAGADATGNAGAVTSVKAADGLEYLVLTVEKTPGWSSAKHTAEVSSNLVDWFSGDKHTTTLVDDATTFRVRDNTPVTKGVKRYIRIK